MTVPNILSNHGTNAKTGVWIATTFGKTLRQPSTTHCYHPHLELPASIKPGIPKCRKTRLFAISLEALASIKCSNSMLVSNFPTTARSLKGCSKAWISRNYSVVHGWVEQKFCKSLWINYFLPHSQRQEILPKTQILNGSEWFPYSCRLSLRKTWTWPGCSPLALTALIFPSAH